MEKEFVKYENALLLKNIGFNGFCLGVWDNQSKELFLNDTRELDITELPTVFILAPLYQQAVDFLLSQLDDDHSITIYGDESGFITRHIYQQWVDNEDVDFGSREEMIQKLIKLVK